MACCRIGINGHEGREKISFRNLCWRHDRTPDSGIASSEIGLERRDCGIVLAYVRQEVFKCKKWVTDVGFSPIYERTAFWTNNNVGGVKVAVAKCLRNLKCRYAVKSI